MKKTLLLAVALAVVGTSGVNAASIVGGISLAGSYTVDTGNLNTADAFTSFTDVLVVSRSLNYVPLVAIGTGVTMTPFSFDPFPAGGILPLWITAGGVASFDLHAPISVVQPGDNTMDLKGFGTLYLSGYDPTPGSWVFTANQGAASFSFSSSNAALPDGGMTVMLLGAALTSLGFIRRKISA